MVAEGELRCNLDDSDKVRELQDKVADLKAEVFFHRHKSKALSKLCHKIFAFVKNSLYKY